MSEPLVIISLEQLQTIIDNSLSKFLPLISQHSAESSKPIVPIYLSRKEACSMLQVTYPTLEKYTKKGILKAHYIGRRVLYIQQEILAALDSSSKFIIGKKKAA